MALILIVLLLALLLGGLGFAVHVLWWIALIVLVVWLVGFLVRMGEGGSRGRWYRWLPQPAPVDQPSRASRASPTVSYSGNRSARPVIQSALVYR